MQNSSDNYFSVQQSCHFLSHLTFYLHPSRIYKIIPRVLVEKLLQRNECLNTSHMYLSRYILEKNNDSLSKIRDVPSQHWPLLVLSHKDVEHIARFIGALELGPKIRRTISGHEIRQIENILSPTVVDFVRMRHGGFYHGSKKWSAMPVSEIGDFVLHAGYAVLAKAAGAMDAASSGLWLMRLPTEVDFELVSHISSGRSLKLLKELHYELASL